MDGRMGNLSMNIKLKEDAKECGFDVMTEVQRACIPEMLKGKDVIVQAPTGTGKTMAFLTPILDYVYADFTGNAEVTAVVIAPTRELSLQIKAVADMFKCSCECFIGGISIEDDYAKMQKCIRIAVGTPGRLFEIISKYPKQFARVRYIILDEADKLLGYGFEEKLMQIMKMLPRSRIAGLFSATINESVDKLSLVLLRNPVRIKVGSGMMPVCLEYVVIRPADKILALMEIATKRRCIVFFATCSQVDFFSSLFVEFGVAHVSKIHGRMAQEERSKVYEQFVAGEGMLFCTDVAARGIDFKEVELVVHFDVPKDYNNIVHRSGRTARNGSKGESVVFVMPNEKAYVEFLKLKGICVAECSRAIDPSVTHEDIKARITPELLDAGVKAFVSYIRSYKEHVVSYILDYKGLDYNSLVDLFFLEKVPGMAELKHVKFERFEKPDRKALKDSKEVKKVKKAKLNKKHSRKQNK
ncbi:DEAD/DEAH box helicase [Ordospora pajunii]|uniref:DEAD/DEAH box helicase n=1 Tax=Ordospora pajunii TaxID=3039483 RepID=UPI0029528D40|nr:DEAD/DEAH box helicase [Ordospora pajunii]KAH9411476.1 DEAD/DEAH box helicase [Ordospora pajunii]